MKHKSRSIAITIFVAGVGLTGSTGCSKALGLEDWQRDLLSLGLSQFSNLFLTTTTITQRQCFEDIDGTLVEINCSDIPAG